MALGSDFAGIDDLDWSLSTVSGRVALAHALLRRLTTPKGRLVTNTNYGYSIPDQVGATPSLTEVQQGVSDQVFAEEEVQDASIEVFFENELIRVRIVVEDSEGPFDLTITATPLTAEAFINGSPFWSNTTA